MKTIAILFAMLISSVFHAQTDTKKTNDKGSIEVLVSNVTGEEGKVIFALYDEESFMKKEPVNSAVVEISEGKAIARFENVAPGTYAVVSLHDKNGNGRMDFGPGGMPEEDYGTSNNPMSYGPPNWGDSNFDFEEGVKKLEIRF